MLGQWICSGILGDINWVFRLPIYSGKLLLPINNKLVMHLSKWAKLRIVVFNINIHRADVEENGRRKSTKVKTFTRAVNGKSRQPPSAGFKCNMLILDRKSTPQFAQFFSLSFRFNEALSILTWTTSLSDSFLFCEHTDYNWKGTQNTGPKITVRKSMSSLFWVLSLCLEFWVNMIFFPSVNAYSCSSYT